MALRHGHSGHGAAIVAASAAQMRDAFRRRSVTTRWICKNVGRALERTRELRLALLRRTPEIQYNSIAGDWLQTPSELRR